MSTGNGNGKEVAKKEAAALAAAAEFEDVASAGMETIDASDLLIPRIAIAQALSPQLDKNDAAFIEGAERGDIIDTSMGGKWKTLRFVPVVYRKNWVEWAPRASAKGMVNIHDNSEILADCKPNERGVPVTPDGNTVIETANFFGFHLDEREGVRRAFIAMSSSQLRAARKWLSLATGEKLVRKDGTTFTPPLFYRVYQLGTTELKNAEGSWHGWRIDRAETVPEWCESRKLPMAEFKAEAMAFHTAVADGSTKPVFGPEPAEDGDNGEPL